MIPVERLAQIRERLAFVEARLAAGAAGADIAALGREHAELAPVVAQIDAFEALRRELAETEAMLREPEMRALAEEELPGLRARLAEAEAALARALVPRDAADDRSAILEIRAGTGGEEAALFAADLLRMYQRYAEAKGWRVELISEAPTELGGYREVVAAVRGPGVFARLKWESGTHRVQRVPQTEAGGRIHTSAATVAVL
ncbi:MAG: peptide chain release factor 1, partial [Alphaproteobacteria bacterium HGW-Alphaproteobacteria-2]